MPPMVLTSVPKYLLSKFSLSPMLSKIFAPRYERMVEMPIFDMIFFKPLSTALI